MIKPGYSQPFEADRIWVLEFGSGGSKGDLRYTLAAGEYTFRANSDGWDLVQTTAKATKADDAPPPPARDE